MESFESISKSLDSMILILGLKRDLMVLDICVKFGSNKYFDSGDIGSTGVSNGVFREFFKTFR